VIGFASSEIPKIPLNLVLLKGCQIVGVFWGSFAARNPARNREHAIQLFRWIAEGKLRPAATAPGGPQSATLSVILSANARPQDP